MSRALETIDGLRRELKKWLLDEVLPNLIVNTLVAATSAVGNKDAVETVDGANDGPALESGQQAIGKGQRPVSRSLPWGLSGRPVKGLRAYSLRFGSSNVLFFGIAPTTKYGPQNLKEGETAVYSAEVEKGMHLDEDGKNNINAKSGQDVIVNGGTKPVARKDDKTIADTSMSSWITNITNAVNAATGGTIATPTDFGKINEGAEHFKG